MKQTNQQAVAVKMLGECGRELWRPTQPQRNNMTGMLATPGYENWLPHQNFSEEQPR
jgi:hypothetical protein